MPPRKQKKRTKQSSQSTPKLRFEKAMRAFEAGKLLKAKEALQGVLRQSPDHLDAMILLARIHAQNADYRRSTCRLERAIRLAPKNAELRKLAEVAYQAGEREVALNALQVPMTRSNTCEHSMDCQVCSSLKPKSNTRSNCGPTGGSSNVCVR